MEAVIWLEDYLSRWNRILLLVSHSQGTKRHGRQRTPLCCYFIETVSQLDLR